MNDDPPLLQGQRYARQAEEARDKGHWQQAIDKHDRACRQFLIALGLSTNPQTNKTLIDLIDVHYRTSARIRQHLGNDSALYKAAVEYYEAKDRTKKERVRLDFESFKAIQSSFNEMMEVVTELKSPPQMSEHYETASKFRHRLATKSQTSTDSEGSDTPQESFFFVQGEQNVPTPILSAFPTLPVIGSTGNPSPSPSPSTIPSKLDAKPRKQGPRINENFFDPVHKVKVLEEKIRDFEQENAALHDSLTSLVDDIESQQKIFDSFKLNLTQKSIVLRTDIDNAKSSASSSSKSQKEREAGRQKQNLAKQVAELRKANAKYAEEYAKLSTRTERLTHRLRKEVTDNQKRAGIIKKYSEVMKKMKKASSHQPHRSRQSTQTRASDG